MREIAEKAGVSVSTVSRVLNDQPGISEETRERVLAAARELNYAPQMAARSLATERTHYVALLGIKYDVPQPFTESHFGPQIARGVEEELSRHGYHLVLTSLDPAQLQDALSLKIIRERRVDGVLLDGPAIPSRFIVQLKTANIPLVLIDNELKGLAVDRVLCDNEQGAYEATRHLSEHGHTKIVALSGPDEWPSNHERCQGYRRAMTEAGLTPQIIHQPATTVETGEQAMAYALAAYPDVTAVFAINDPMAIGAIRAIKDAGRRVPEDIAVVGFDDGSWAELNDPPLTTVHVFKYAMGSQAAHRLIQILEGDVTVPMRITVGTELVIRKSCGCL
jgi:DNA-binding LacI/PurR family transcriptional regulator